MHINQQMQIPELLQKQQTLNLQAIPNPGGWKKKVLYLQ